MNVRWDGDVFGNVVVGAVALKSPDEISQFLHANADLSVDNAQSLGRMCYFMCIREARQAGDGFVLHSADRYLDSLDVAGLPQAAKNAIDDFKEQLFATRAEPGHILLKQAFENVR